jgi:hypothetical protein
MRLPICLLVFTTFFCFIACRDKYPGEPLSIRNNSDHRIYYWFSYWRTATFPKYHYPDTILPNEKPVYLNSIATKNAIGSGESDPDWTKIFSKLPQGKLSIYFFDVLPETQEAWNLIIQSYNLTRKDITYQELKSNNFTILYP